MTDVEVPSAVDLAPELESFRQNARHNATSSVLVVDGLPVVSAEKADKLLAALSKIFAKVGQLRYPSEDGGGGGGGGGRPPIVIPRDEAGTTLGFALVEYVDAEQAAIAAVATNRFQFGRSNTFAVMNAADVLRICAVADTFTPPPEPPVANIVAEKRINLKGWLLEGRGRDQFAVRHGLETDVMWHDPVLPIEKDYGRAHWTDSYVVWSPLGSYLTTFHLQGVALWGGTKWEKIVRFAHPNVKLVDYSPNEKYLVTYNGLEPERDDPADPKAVIVWEIATGMKLRSFVGPPVMPDEPLPWPLFRWSYDDGYVARMGKDLISVYEMPSVGLLDKKSIKVPGVRDFAWSPTDNYLVYWTPEHDEAPARVCLMELPSREELRQKALYAVADIKLHWQQEGNFLCCKIDRFTKSRKGQFTNFELFRVKAKNIPIEIVEYKEKDDVQAFAWEPKGVRFAVIHRDTPGSGSVSFFSMEGKSGTLKPLFTVEGKTCNQLHWSPQGNFIVLATLAAQAGALEFYNANDQELLGTGEHYMCTDLAWDPTGRFLTSSVSFWRNKMENGFSIWTFNGKELTHESRDELYQFVWRPRPKSLLDAAAQKKVKKELRSYRERYEKEDDELRASRASRKAASRKALRDAWQAYLDECEARRVEEAAQRREARGGIESDNEDDYEVIQEDVTDVIDIQQEVDTSRKMLNSEDERD